MRAIAINEFGGLDSLTLMDLPVSDIAPDEVLVRVQAVGVGAWDEKVSLNTWGLALRRPRSFPLIIGWESSGIVERVGADVTHLREGDEVYSYVPHTGHFAEYVALPAALVALKPTSVDFIHAAAVPVAGLTAHQCLVDDLGLKPGEKVLITGAAGGTGSFAVQIAASMGVHVIATGSEPNHAYLQKLGAHEVVDYRHADFVKSIRAHHPDGIDAVLDCAGGETLQRSVDALHDNGRLVYIAERAPHLRLPRGIQAEFIHAKPNTDRLTVLARMIDDRRLTVQVQEVLPLEQAAHALKRVKAGHVRGKIVLMIRETS